MGYYEQSKWAIMNNVVENILVDWLFFMFLIISLG